MEDLEMDAELLLDTELLDAGALDSDLSDATLLDAGMVADSAEAMPVLDADPGERITIQVARAEYACGEIARATARQLEAIHATIQEARAFPEVFIGPGPDTDPERIEFAVRAAVAELATSLSVSQQSVRSQLHEADVLHSRLHTVWAEFSLGHVSYQNVRVIIDNSLGLPDDEAIWSQHDTTLAGPAATVNTARMRILARSLREKLATEPLTTRHKRARKDRRVWVDADQNGMAWLGSLQPAEAAYRAYARVNANAKHLAAQPGETRTMAQIRADVMADLLTGDGTDYQVKATVTVTVPVMTLLDAGEAADPATYRPGMLNGYGPIDADTARKLAGNAPSFFRILTHPISSAILDVDRNSYRVPADLKRWIQATQLYCGFPGCNKLAEECDIDHNLDWAYLGVTSLENLAVVCRDQHRLKHNSKWTIIREPDGAIRWKSPLGRIHDTDPPPF
jgi:hypothetical protein